MFLDLTLKRNPELIKAAFELHQSGEISPDTYVLDVDSILYNAGIIKEEADRLRVKLYFMTKQFGRNPYIAKEIMKLGYEGAVAVDYREAEVLYKNGVNIGHMGHIVQLPSHSIKNMLLSKPQVITVYSMDKAREISRVANELKIEQNVMLRVIDDGDVLYPGQYGGFYLKDVLDAAREISRLPNLKLNGVTSFPCFLFNEEESKVLKTRNADTVIKAREIVEEKLAIKLEQINLPSANCKSTIKNIFLLGGTHGEPGHSLTGTTPLHKNGVEDEIPSIVYVSEVSHSLNNNSYIYGGGHYRRSHMSGALVGRGYGDAVKMKTAMPSEDSIDYYIELEGRSKVGMTALLAFRTQVFVTRSQVALVKGIRNGNAQLVGIYNSQGSNIRGGE